MFKKFREIYGFGLLCYMAFLLTPAICSSTELQAVSGRSGNAIIHVSNNDNLRVKFKSVDPGTTIVLAPGRYRRGLYFKNIHGKQNAPIIITGSDPDNPPIFEGLGEGLKVSSGSYLKFKNIIFRGFSTNGVNIDDGGNINQPSHHIILENIFILNIGSKGNHDALKMSGVDHFIVRHCRFEGWGGSGTDLVGCHNGVIENSSYIGKDGYRTGNSIQIKGGSRSILIQNNYFENSGSRIVQVGGLTGQQYFRPTDTAYEATDVYVAGNTFVGGEAQIAWVTAQNSHVYNNLFYLPMKWLGRILQETKKSQFAPCRGGIFSKNIVITDDNIKTIFNIGRGTEPESFLFRANVWSASTREIDQSLPTSEINGLYDIKFMVERDLNGRICLAGDNPLVNNVGPLAYRSWQSTKDFIDIDISSNIPKTIDEPFIPVTQGDKPASYLKGSASLGVIVFGVVVVVAVLSLMWILFRLYLLNRKK